MRLCKADTATHAPGIHTVLLCDGFLGRTSLAVVGRSQIAPKIPWFPGVVIVSPYARFSSFPYIQGVVKMRGMRETADGVEGRFLKSRRCCRRRRLGCRCVSFCRPIIHPMTPCESVPASGCIGRGAGASHGVCFFRFTFFPLLGTAASTSKWVCAARLCVCVCVHCPVFLLTLAFLPGAWFASLSCTPFLRWHCTALLEMAISVQLRSDC